MPQARFTVSEAAKLYGRDRKTLYRHISHGKLSCDLDADNVKRISLSELIRSYGEPPQGETTDPTVIMAKLNAAHESERQAWSAALDAKKKASALKDEVIELQKRLLPSPEKAEKSRRWWQFWK